ncbi:hypothetical protein EYC80_004087 [Monilinia laxa]|uniref:Uncharacterized protein n=1 Tax=Monilinia laxa TaxID=61186 RepID=A0A5N6KLM6_MONLA|nr:hypothetical protein EYC80_004087 [Monilinia laxa]
MDKYIFNTGDYPPIHLSLIFVCQNLLFAPIHYKERKEVVGIFHLKNRVAESKKKAPKVRRSIHHQKYSQELNCFHSTMSILLLLSNIVDSYHWLYSNVLFPFFAIPAVRRAPTFEMVLKADY